MQGKQNINKRQVVILSIIFVLIIALILICIFLIRTDNKSDTRISEIETPEGSYDFELNKIARVENKSDYYLVNKCITRFYYNYINDIESVPNYLDNEYIKTFNINENNLIGKYGNFQKVKTDILDMYVSQVGIGVYTYFVYGNLIDMETGTISDLAIMVKVDTHNKTFSILPYEYLKNNNYLKINENSTIHLKQLEEVANKKDNKYTYKYIDEQTYIDELFERYINRSLYNIEKAYNSLNSKYRMNHFKNLQEFKEFIENKRELYMSYNSNNKKEQEDFKNIKDYNSYLISYIPLKIKSYKKTEESEYTQYILIDNFNNYYVFRETEPFKYTVALDTYSIDLPEFIEKYYTAEDTEKVALNIQKIFDAMNNKDYNYIYNKFTDGFKERYFKTIEEFEKYVNKNFFDENEVNYLFYKKESEEYYSYTIKVIDQKTKKAKDLKIIMELLDGTDFNMSFNVD